MYSPKYLVSQKNLFQKSRKSFVYWSDFNKLLAEVSKYWCFWNRAVRFSQTFTNLILTVLKQYHLEQNPKVVFYWKYKKFRKNLFRSELENESFNYNINNMEYDIFLRTFLKIFDKYAPMKKYIYIWGQTKEVRKAIMLRSKLRNKFLKHKNEQ